MKGTNGISTVAVTLFFVLLGLSLSLSTVQAQWTRLGLDEGGVGEDVQLLRLEDNSLGDVVWSANMEGGLFRATWSGGSWGSWSEYLPGRFMFGVEAICVEDTDYVDMEYVLAATGTMGLWYNQWYIQNPPAAGAWPRPNGEDYPGDWHWAFTHDAAFYCNTNGNWPEIPQESFFVILSDTIGDDPQNPSFVAGIYRWDVAPANTFVRVDAASPTTNARGFSHFWRDLSVPNVLYSIMGPGDGYNGGLCKISGDYADPDFELVTIVPSGQGELKEVLGFNQWEYGSYIYSYALVLRSVGGNDSYDVWFSTNLAGSSPSFTLLTNLNSVYFTSYEDDWSNVLTLPLGGKIIGKPYQSGQDIEHKLWITSANGDNGVMYGVLYKDTYYPNDPPIQVNGDDEEGCKSWADRAFTPDPGHLGSSTMRFFMGTHKHGVWYLDFTSTNDYDWTPLYDGYMGIDTRGGFKLYCIENTSMPEILMPGWNTGIFRYNGSEWVERGISGLDGNSYHTDPAFRHGSQSACDFNGYTYWGGGPGQMKMLNGPLITQGGLYRFGNNDVTTQVNFLEDEGYSLAQQDSFTISNLEVGRNADISHLYLTTGIWGPEDHMHAEHLGDVNYICMKDSATEVWSTICEMTDTDNPSYANLSVVALEPSSLDPINGIYIALGNVFAWTATIPAEHFWARVELIENIGGTWGTTWSWTETLDYSTALDVATMPDPQNTGKDIVFWGVNVLSDQGGSAAPGLPNKGMVYMRRWNPAGQGQYQAYSLYASGSGVTVGDKTFELQPTGFEVACFELGGIPHLVASIGGKIGGVFHAYIYTARIVGTTAVWNRLDNPMLGGIELDMVSQEIKIDPQHGYDFYVGADAGVMLYDNFYQPSPVQSANWNWVSFDNVDPQDSLKYLFAGADSLEVIRDQYGNRYKPYDNPPLDEIHVWNWFKCYDVKSWVADTMAVFGLQIPADSAMVLYPAPQDSSWIYNYIAYLPTDTFNVNECFLADSDTVLIVKQDDGNFWKPGDGPDFDMVPGEGYHVGVNDTMTFQYPTQGSSGIQPPPNPKQNLPQIASLEPSHFLFAKKTGDFYPIYIEDILINGLPPQAGDEAAVFAPNDLCVGAVVYEDCFPLKIAGWKDDPCTEAVDGYTPGDTLSFELYDASAGVEVPLEMMAIAQSYPPSNSYAFTRFEQGYYAQHHLQASFALPGSYALLQNYPNPFNPATTIRYDLPFESIVKLEIFDLMGRKVVTLVDGKQAAGFRAIHWNGRNAFGAGLASGVYFYRLTADATQIYLGKKEHFTKSHKMVMIK